MTLAGPEPKSGRTLADGCITWAVTQPGTYTVTEEDQAGWTPQGATSADFTVVSDGGPYSHTFVNFEDVTITACKQNIGGAAIKDWLMTLTGPDPKSGKTLADGCITWTVTKPGAYTVTEEDRAGWTPQGATSADFTVVSGGGPYSHTFVNLPHPLAATDHAIRCRRGPAASLAGLGGFLARMGVSCRNQIQGGIYMLPCPESGLTLESVQTL